MMCHRCGHCRHRLDVILTPLPYLLIKIFINFSFKLLHMSWRGIWVGSCHSLQQYCQGRSKTDDSQSLFIITGFVVMNDLVLVVCLTLTDWSAVGEASVHMYCTVVQSYTPADHTHSHLTVHSSHMCLWDQILYNFTTFYQAHSELRGHVSL